MCVSARFIWLFVFFCCPSKKVCMRLGECFSNIDLYFDVCWPHFYFSCWGGGGGVVPVFLEYEMRCVFQQHWLFVVFLNAQ